MELNVQTGKQGPTFLDVYFSKTWLLGPQEGHSWDAKLATNLFTTYKDLHTSQRGRASIYNLKFSEGNVTKMAGEELEKFFPFCIREMINSSDLY